MKLELRPFRTKVALRIFVLFIVCTLLPVSVLAFLSYGHVRSQLEQQSRERLRQEAKTVSVSLYERLLMISTQLRFVTSELQLTVEPDPNLSSRVNEEGLKAWFETVEVIRKEGAVTLVGEGGIPLGFSAAELHYLQKGNLLLRHRMEPFKDAEFFLYLAVDAGGPDTALLGAEFHAPYLWEAAIGRPPGTDLLILDAQSRVLFSTLDENVTVPVGRRIRMRDTHTGMFDFESGDVSYVATYRSIFLRSNYYYPEWVVILCESRDNILAPMSGFTRKFFLLVLFSLAMVFVLSENLIRKNMGPVATLMDGTRKISEGELGHTVDIRSGDEFERFGNAFNEMSRKLAESQEMLVQAARMTTMGQMASGMVHEIRQPLSAIHALLQLSLMDVREAEERERIESSLHAVKRLDEILSRFKSFSYKSPDKMTSLHLDRVVDGVLSLLRHQMKVKAVDCEVKTDGNLPPILGDRTGLEQVVSNLVINAMDAIVERGHGYGLISIEIRTTNDRVVLSVEDNGCGIPEDFLDRIYDPFFTTKPPDKGTGLGMAIIQAILHQHNAEIELTSKVDAGT
ncbi:MAG: HAMP domain-containing protein, partial [Desulfobacteraceae bacterium]|nr:HAMP domain-containing protein [Desulfobacteraceae bacterium]